MEFVSPAKINLFLAVSGRRPDGYHEIVSLMCPVALYDHIRIVFGGKGVRVTCSHPEVPSDRTNLAGRAAEAYLKALEPHGRPPWTGIHIYIDKTIPVGAGLGGGSSNAAAVLTALNRSTGAILSIEELMAVGLTLGADVPFFIRGGPAIARGVGERLERYSGLPPLWAVIVYPGFSISTATVYGQLKMTLTKCEKKLRKVLLKKEHFSLRTHLCNDLETVSINAYPVIGTVKDALLASGAEGAAMSGSGSAVFGLYCDAEEAAAVRANVATRQPEWQVFHAALMAA